MAKEEQKKETVKINIQDENGTEQEQEQNKADSQDEKENQEEKPLEDMLKKELIQRVTELQEKVDSNFDQYLRAQAEIENIIKRNKKEKEDWIKYSNENLIKKILPVIDNLEKAVSFSNNDNQLNGLKEGVELTLKSLMDALTKAGVEEVEAEGKAFDPAYHHAVFEQEDEKVEPGIVLKELQKGYTLNQRLIRPSMVVLSKNKAEQKV